MAVTPTLPTPPSHSARDLATAAGDSARPNKRLRVTKGNNAMPATARSSSPESSAKASSDEEAKGRRKPRTRVTENEFRGHIKREKTWLDTASSGCSNIRRVFTQQKNFLEELEAIEKEFSHIVTDLSVEQAISRQARLRLSGELEHVEERRRRVISNLCKAMTRGSTEGDEMKQNLEKWCVKDSKVTSRIERSH
jgi:hypothetical protein